MQAPTMRDKAVALAQQGFRVFPLRANSKKPPIVPANKPKPPTGQYHDAIPSSDPAEVASMWTDNKNGASHAYNIGISCDGMFVIDVDNKGTKYGDGALSEFAQESGLELKTLETRTPTGGRHLFYKLPKGAVASNKVNTLTLAPGLDVRGRHGYVVAPGSVVPEGEYRWARGPDVAKMAPAPYSIVDICRSPVQLQPKNQQPVTGVELDQPEDIDRARLWLINDAPEAIENRGGNHQTYEVACAVRDFLISEPMCLELMTHWWNRAGKAHPPWSPGELEQIVSNAYSYAQNAIGANSAQAQFEPVSIEGLASRDVLSQEPVTKKTRLFVRSFDESRERGLRDDFKPLIEGYLERGAMSVLYGDSGAGKTFVALDMAYHIAAGLDWNGRKTVGGPVLYVAAEAGESINARIAALHEHYKPKTPPPLGVVPCLVNLFTPGADLKELTEVALGWADKCGAPLAHMTLDTLARVIGPGDENSARDMGILVQNIDRMRVATGAHQMLVHHSGKNKANGARGSSALRAATDTELEVEGGKIKMRKQRSAEEARPIAFKLRQVVIGQNDNGSVTSCVVDKGAAVDFVPQVPPEEETREALLWAYQLEWQKKTRSIEACQFTTTRLFEAWRSILGTDICQCPDEAMKKRIRRYADIAEKMRTLELISLSTDKERVFVLRTYGQNTDI